MMEAGRELINSGAKNVLIKGGHLKADKMIDILINKKLIKNLKLKILLKKYARDRLHIIFSNYNIFIMWKI